jgi:preprotein translocase subunit SecA
MVGMTATAHTEAEEFKKLYSLEVARIPTNRSVIREDLFYVVDERSRTVKVTERGMELIEEELGSGFMTLEKIPPNPPFSKGGTGKGGTEELRNFMQLLRAFVLHRQDEDYVVSNGGITIVDEFTGRLAFGKKYEEGLHQAIECKEGLQITPENRVVKMVGMTATAHTEAEEFKKLYSLEVARIPTNRSVIREDLPDRFYRTEEEKLEAIIDEVKEYHSQGRPVLVGTRSVEKSERLSALLEQYGISHNTLNAKNHAQEAEIIEDAGQPCAVTIATNMAGRGTDIALGDPKLGLHVIGSERHGARRIDHQLMGRSGRQGDPGSSRFHLSLQDELFRVFGREEMSAIVKAFDRGNDADMMSALPGLARLVRRAQRKSEETSYDIRKRLIERDDITDRQRKTIYQMRQEALASEWTKDRIRSLIADYVQDTVDIDEPTDMSYLEELRDRCMSDFGARVPKLDVVTPVEDIKKAIVEAFEETYGRRESALGTEFSRKLGRAAMLEALETAWADYLSFQSEFDRSLSLRSYVKGNTLVDYRLESARLFEDLLASVRREALRDIFTYPLPGEKVDSIHRAGNSKPISRQVKELVY